MKKTVFRCGCFLLLFAMLFLSSCKGSEKPPVDTGVSAEPILPEQLKGYSLVRPQMTSEGVISGASDLYEAMLTLLGGTPDFGTDFLEAGKEADSSKKEILVGHTNRPETAQVLETLKAGEFAVAAVGNKLVITGFTEAFTPLAVQWFLANYLTGTAAEVTDAAEKVNALRLLCRKLAPENPCWQGDFHDCIGHTAVWRITVAEITGKANRGKPE